MGSPFPEPDMSRLQGVFTTQRKAHGQTFDELMRATGLARQTLLNLSAGRYIGDLRTWAILAKAWRIPLDELIAPIWEQVVDTTAPATTEAAVESDAASHPRPGPATDARH